MTTRSRNLTLLVVVLMLAAIGFYFAGEGTNASALDAVPARSFLVATVDLERLRASPFGSKLGDLGERGVAEVKETCGFDPLARAKELAVCVPEEEAPGEFGVVARGDLGTLEVAKCAQKLAEVRGGGTRVSEANGFTIVEDDSKERAVSRIAMRPNGPLLVGAGRWLDTMMVVIRTGQGSVVHDEAHASLRSSVAGGSPAIVITAVLPKPMRERVRAQMGEEAREGRGASAMDGVLGVAQIAAAFDPGDAKRRAELTVELRCETDDQCASVERLIARKKENAEGDARLRLIGVSGVLADVRVTRSSRTVRATLSHDAEDLARVAQATVTALSAQTAQTTPSTRDEKSWGEKVTAPRDGGRE